MMNEKYVIVNTVKDTHTLKCNRNLTQLLQTKATQIEELEKKTCKFQELCKQFNCCEIQDCFNWINFSNHLVVAIENWNHESSKLTKAKNHRSAKKCKAKKSNETSTSIISFYGSSLISPLLQWLH